MNKSQSFQEYLASEAAKIIYGDFILNMLIAALLAILLSRAYVNYGNSLSNRKNFAKNFILITLGTTLIITLVKSSLALSLGLVGALSIVRFRTPIKEPEELTYLYLCIAIGVGLGADQRFVTVSALIVIYFIVWLRQFYSKSVSNHNLFLTVASDGSKITLDSLVAILEENCEAVKLRRFDESSDMMEACFLVEFKNIDQMNDCKIKLHDLNDKIRITFLDNVNV